MADIEYFDDPMGPRDPAGGFGITQWLGAACSLALVVGLGVWAVQLVLRDVSDVPVIQALGTPMRIQPADPGGTQMEHQGLAVNEIRAGGIATPAPESIVLAPPPVTLDEPAAAVLNTSEQTAPAGTVAPLSQDAGVVSLTEALAPSAPSALPSATTLQILPASVPGVSRSARPLQRPASLRRPDATQAAVSAAVSAASRAVIDVDPASVPAGTRLVQLGAFDDAGAARREWDRLYGQFGDYMEGKQRMVMRARSGGRDFYRLRVVGFDGANDARRFCSAFLARNTACIPVVSR